ncbi:MAG: PspA/IM30 family protein [Moraxella sp.]|nr:PspA/IM30 family protein [Moraxella sp.]
MSETLAQRAKRLVSGGFHAVLDKAEDLAPEATLNENVREIERAIDEVRTELGKVLAQKHLASKKLSDENSRHEALSASIATALQLGKDELATVGVAEQIDIEARLPILENTIADCILQEQELEGFVTALQAKRREMLQALEDYKRLKAQSVGESVLGISSSERIAQNVAKSSNAFDRVMARQTGLTLEGSDTAKLAGLKELEELSRTVKIAERLAKLKSEQTES